jgi:GAF domain-containing protein
MGDLRQMTQAFVDLADTLVDEFDVIELLHVLTGRCVELLGVDAAGVMLAGPSGQLRVAAASSERARLLELFELQNDEGPCLDCFRTAAPVAHADLGDGKAPWPRFAAHATRDGLFSAHALPMRLRQQVIGALNLFRHEPTALPDDDVRIAQAFADIATIALLQERLVHEQTMLAEQLQAALNSRIVIEQAKGVLAERANCDMETAFATLRSTARRHNTRLSDLAGEVVATRGDPTLPG